MGHDDAHDDGDRIHDDLGCRPPSALMIPVGDPAEQAADPDRRPRGVLELELAELLALVEQLPELPVELVPQVADAPCVVGVEALLLALVDADIFLVLDDDPRDPLDDHLELLSRGTVDRQRVLERGQRQLNAGLADLRQELALVPIVGIDERLGDVQLLGDGIERRRLIAVGEEQVTGFLDDPAALIGGHLVLQLRRLARRRPQFDHPPSS